MASVEFDSFHKVLAKEGDGFELPSKDFLNCLLAAQTGTGGKKKPRSSNNKKDEESKLESKDVNEA